MSTPEWRDEGIRCAAADALESETSSAGRSFESVRKKLSLVRMVTRAQIDAAASREQS